MSFRTLLVLAALAAPIAATASEPAAQPDPRAAQSAPRGDRQAPVELICRSVETAGASEASPMVCMSAADWRRAEQ